MSLYKNPFDIKSTPIYFAIYEMLIGKGVDNVVKYFSPYYEKIDSTNIATSEIANNVNNKIFYISSIFELYNQEGVSKTIYAYFESKIEVVFTITNATSLAGASNSALNRNNIFVCNSLALGGIANVNTQCLFIGYKAIIA